MLKRAFEDLRPYLWPVVVLLIIAHDLSYAVFLGAVYPAVTESYDVDSCEIVVNCSTGEDPIDTSTSSPDEASEIVSGVLVALEDCISSITCD